MCCFITNLDKNMTICEISQLFFWDLFVGSAYKSGSLKYLRKSFVIDENRRGTYTLPEVVNSLTVPSVLTAFDGERKQLIPVSIKLDCNVKIPNCPLFHGLTMWLSYPTFISY